MKSILAIEKISKTFQSYYNEKIRNKPPHLYHYTNADGLCGIINSNKMWASDIRFLNDSEEFIHILEITKKVLNENTIQNKSKKNGMLSNGFFLFDDKITQVYFALSFSEQADRLSQWRGYCKNGGFSIETDFKILNETADTQENCLFPCIYDDDIKKRIVSELLSVHNFNRVQFLSCLMTLSPIFKHSSFSEEKEWRIVIDKHFPNSNNSTQDVLFRTKGTFVLPYVEFKFENLKSAIKSIIVGPTQYPQISKDSLNMFLSAKGFSPSLKLTTCAYREL